MSRVTPPVTRVAHIFRNISSSAHAARPSSLLDSQSRVSRYLPRNVRDLRAECKQRALNSSGSKSELVDRLAAHDIVGIGSTHGFHSGHRPSTVTPVYRIVPLMQGFKTSAPKQAARDTSTIDFFFFPEVPAAPPTNPFSKLRVPLLPDNYSPDRSPESGNAIEVMDEAVPRPEISIVASHPEDVVPATISEVVGNDGLDVDIGQLTAAFSNTAVAKLKEPGIFRELWSGFVDDIFGPKRPMTI